MRAFFVKIRGGGGVPPRAALGEVFWSWLGGFVGIALVGWLDQGWLHDRDVMFLVGSFGASAVLLYGAPASPLAQPRNLIVGHLLSALVGVACYRFLPLVDWVVAAAAVSGAIAAMHLTRSLHPPGGAPALIAVIGSEQVHALGFRYALTPILAGACLMLLVALLVNNLVPGRRYPLWW